MASPSCPPLAGLIRAANSAQQQQQHPSGLSTAASPYFQQPKITHTANPIATASPTLQNPRVAHLQFTAGNNVSSPGLQTRFSTPAVSAQSTLYSASANSSIIAQNTVLAQSFAPARPPVPPFPHSAIPGKMVLEDMPGFGDYEYFEAPVFPSPNMASSFDMHSSGSSSSSSMIGTVSPNDLLLQDPIISAPNSAALTSLTSPSDYHESPCGDPLYVSPHYATGKDFDGMDSSNWASLFQPATQPASLDSADDTAAAQQATSSRRKSGHSRASSVSSKPSSSAGVNPSRRRDKPLPPIVIDDPNDTVAMKRARNTLAARKSRERKAMRFDELEEEIARLKEERDRMKAERDHWMSVAVSKQ